MKLIPFLPNAHMEGKQRYSTINKKAVKKKTIILYRLQVFLKRAWTNWAIKHCKNYTLLWVVVYEAHTNAKLSLHNVLAMETYCDGPWFWIEYTTFHIIYLLLDHPIKSNIFSLICHNKLFFNANLVSKITNLISWLWWSFRLYAFFCIICFKGFCFRYAENPIKT